MEVSALKHPLKSHREAIRLPAVSPDLAEFMGVEFGDGGINNPWQVVVTVNSDKDRTYARYLSSLIQRLFGLEPVLRKRPWQKALVVVASSATLVDFLISKGAARGNKIAQQIDVPKRIVSQPELERRFVRGLVDTDGCLYIHHHTIKGVPYRNIGLCFTSLSQKLLYSVARILDRNSIKPHISNGKHVYLYRQESVTRYLGIFGSSNPRIFRKYEEWRGA